MPHERFCCCCGFLENEPCGYPKGTIRSTLAVIITVIVLLAISAVIVMLLIYQQWALAVAVAEAPLAVLSAVIGYYFGSRTKSKDPEFVIETDELDQNYEPVNNTGQIEELDVV